MQIVVDTPNASNLNNRFTYKKYSVSEMMEAFSKALRQTRTPTPYPMIMGIGIKEAIDRAMINHWEVSFGQPCPNCKAKTSLHNEHCDVCDYPYNK